MPFSQLVGIVITGVGEELGVVTTVVLVEVRVESSSVARSAEVRKKREEGRETTG